MSSDFSAVHQTLEAISRSTWTDLRDGRVLGISQSETTITDRSLLALRREHANLAIHKHPAWEEVRTGADWEWWIGKDGQWTCMLFQAKKLGDDGRYHGLTKRQPNGVPQVDTLIKASWDRSRRLNGTVWPLYCFYNYWHGPWPQGISSQLYPEDKTRRVDERELPNYGCAVLQAQQVRRIVSSESYNNRKTVRDTYLPLVRPWASLFAFSPEISAIGRPQYLLDKLARWAAERPAPIGVDVSRHSIADIPTTQLRLPGSPQDDQASDRDDGDWAAPARRHRRLSLLDPRPIAEPPQYVMDLLEGRPGRPRRLKPLARRVMVLDS